MGKLFDSLLITVWNSKPIWSLNLNFDVGDVEKLGTIESTNLETETEPPRQEQPKSGHDDLMECAIDSIWYFKYIWGPDFDNVAPQRLDNDKCEEKQPKN